MKKFHETLFNESKEFYSLNSLFAEQLSLITDARVRPDEPNKAVCSIVNNNDFDTQPFYKHISRSLKNNFHDTKG